jgi:hypothetical protein
VYDAPTPSEARISPASLRSVCRVALIASLFLGTGAFALDPSRALTQARLSVWANGSGLPQATIDAIVQEAEWIE